MGFFKFETGVFIYDYLIPCMLACILGGIIGYQRERSDRPAGLRTNTLVCLGATVFTLVSAQGFGSSADPTRIAAGIVTGIGFIGAGVIFRQGLFLTGLTTAATIWLVAAIGISIGSGLYYLAFITTALGFLILSLLKYLEDKMSRHSVFRILITANEKLQEHSELNTYLAQFCRNIVYEKAQAQKISADGSDVFVFSIKLESRDSEFSIKAVEIIRKVKGVTAIEIL